jgi:hypothetical protein
MGLAMINQGDDICPVLTQFFDKNVGGISLHFAGETLINHHLYGYAILDTKISMRA